MYFYAEELIRPVRHVITDHKRLRRSAKRSRGKSAATMKAKAFLKRFAKAT